MGILRQAQAIIIFEMNSYAVAVLIIAPEGIPLIRDPKKPPPVFWKAPGGRGMLHEDAETAAIREIKEEIGIMLAEASLEVVHREDKGTHTLVLFTAKVPSLTGIKAQGDEGEEIKVFERKELATLPF